MASPDIIDIESLLEPINEESPSGSDPREDSSANSTYQNIKLERNQARAAERQSIDGFSQEAYNHWIKITELAPTLLANEAKDLEVASWYTEAMVRVYGFSGLKNAFTIIQGLIENFWEQLHPMPDEFGIETRVSCLSGLNGEGSEGVLIAPIRKVFLTQGYAPAPFSLWQYLQALEAQKTPDENAKQQKIQSMGFSLDDIEKAVDESSEAFFVNIRDDLQLCVSIYKEIGTKLDELCGIHEAPPIRSIVEILEECLGAVNHLGRFKFPATESQDETEEDVSMEPQGESGGGQMVKVVKGPVANREDAFKQIQEIATYFRKTEPHSPVSYILEKAVKWGNMPLGDLIGELITDASSRERYSELTGVHYDD